MDENWQRGEDLTESRAQFHQRSTYIFYARGAQKRKKDSQVVSIFLRFWDLCA